MHILACGLNHKTAPIEVRERALFTDAATPDALHSLLALPAVNEAMILSTCNRTELYTHVDDPTVVPAWLAEHHGLKPDQLQPHLYHYHDENAVKHIMRVASGLDSMVLGESQIMSQLKSAYAVAREAGGVGKQFDRLLQDVFSIAKQVRTGTGIGRQPVSVAYTAVNLAKHIFSELSRCNVMLVGAGEMIELCAMHLTNQGVRRMLFANRTVERANDLAQQFTGHAIKIADIPVYLKEADIIITATASQLPIFGKGAIETALKLRRHKPMFMVDIAMPRDVEAEVGELEDVYLYNLDDLQYVIDENLKSRQAAAEQAESMIDIHVKHMLREWHALEQTDVLCAYREKMETLRDDALLKVLNKLQQGEAPDKLLTELARNLTNKLLHEPTVNLRRAAFDGEKDLLLLAKKIFNV